MESRFFFSLWGCSFICLFSYVFSIWIRDRFELSRSSEQRKRAFLWLEIIQSIEGAVVPPPSPEEMHWAIERCCEENGFVFLQRKLKDTEQTTLKNIKKIGEELAYRIADRRNDDT